MLPQREKTKTTTMTTTTNISTMQHNTTRVCVCVCVCVKRTKLCVSFLTLGVVRYKTHTPFHSRTLATRFVFLLHAFEFKLRLSLQR